MSELLIENRGGVRILTMNRPAKRNALNLALTQALLAGLRAAEADESVRSIVLTGAGSAFCAGADLAELKDLTPDQAERVETRAELTMTLHGIFARLSKPVVPAINGAAMGGGAGLALAGDVALMAATATLGYPEVKHGIVAAVVMAGLVRNVGRKAAFELVAGGEPIDAARASALGLVNRVTAPAPRNSPPSTARRWPRPRSCSTARSICRSTRRWRRAATSTSACARSESHERGEGEMTLTTVSYGLADGIATITLDRPESRNALNRAMCEDLIAAAAFAAGDASVRLLLVRGAGKVFCAGADLKERQDMSVDDARNRRLRGFAAYHALESLPMPTIAVVHGAAIGSGSEIAAACDFIVATPETTFSTPEAMWGSVGATQRLARVLGKRLAKDLMFTGRKLTAEEAKIAGLVTRIVDRDRLDAALAEIARSIAKASASELRLAKRCIDQGSELDPRGALAVELIAIEENLAPDAEDTWRGRMAGFKGSS